MFPSPSAGDVSTSILMSLLQVITGNVMPFSRLHVAPHLRCGAIMQIL